MTSSIPTIPILNLSLSFLPVLIVLVILFKWSLNAGHASYAIIRMLAQLLLVGYFLAFIFESDSVWIVLLILAVMVFFSSWIALGTAGDQRRILFKHALLSIALGGGSTLFLVTSGVLRLEPWYLAHYMIPLAGMIFANAMNCISLAVERLATETGRNVAYSEARRIALQTSLIPTINSLLAVGIVALPGMMTGQILSGVSPLIAARYQIMVMCMIFGASGISCIIFLILSRQVFKKEAGMI